MKIKVSEATEVQLDWMVSEAEGEDYCQHDGVDDVGNAFAATRYSTDPSQAYPIIYRENISTFRDSESFIVDSTSTPCKWGSKLKEVWSAVTGEHYFYDSSGNSPTGDNYMEGLTPLIAAMRCYVVSKLGDTVDVPEELCV